MTFVPQDWSNCFLRDGTSWCGRRGGARPRLFWEGDRLGPSPSSVGEGGHPSSTEEREFESSESGGEDSHSRLLQGNVFQFWQPLAWPPHRKGDHSREEPLQCPPKSAARRAAQDLVVQMKRQRARCLRLMSRHQKVCGFVVKIDFVIRSKVAGWQLVRLSNYWQLTVSSCNFSAFHQTCVTVNSRVQNNPPDLQRRITIYKILALKRNLILITPSGSE